MVVQSSRIHRIIIVLRSSLYVSIMLPVSSLRPLLQLDALIFPYRRQRLSFRLQINTFSAFSVARGPVSKRAKDLRVHLARERRRSKANANERYKGRDNECGEVVRMVEVLVFRNEVYHLGRVGRRRLGAEREVHEQPATLEISFKRVREFEDIHLAGAG